MCDTYDYELIRQETIVSHVSATCDCCDQMMPGGTVLVERYGILEGARMLTLSCPTCEFAIAQPEGSPLHLCWGWGWDGEMWGDDRWTWKYIDLCLGVGKTPTEDGCRDFVAQRIAEESEE